MRTLRPEIIQHSPFSTIWNKILNVEVRAMREWIHFSRGDFKRNFKVRTAWWNIQTLNCPSCMVALFSVNIPSCWMEQVNVKRSTMPGWLQTFTCHPSMLEQMKVGNGTLKNQGL
jgi:hypothetical protein